MSKLCNGVPDCTDSSDEGPHCRGIALDKDDGLDIGVKMSLKS